MVFQSALFMSRMIDIDPIQEIREHISNASRVLSRSLVLCELITDANDTSRVPVRAEAIDLNQLVNQLQEPNPDQNGNQQQVNDLDQTPNEQ